MITVTIVPRDQENVYGLMIRKEVELRKANQGTFHRSAAKKAGQEKWDHAKFPGWVKLERCIGNVVVAIVQTKVPAQEWQLLSSFVGFLDRQFRDSIASITITYDAE